MSAALFLGRNHIARSPLTSPRSLMRASEGILTKSNGVSVRTSGAARNQFAELNLLPAGRDRVSSPTSHGTDVAGLHCARLWVTGRPAAAVHPRVPFRSADCPVPSRLIRRHCLQSSGGHEEHNLQWHCSELCRQTDIRSLREARPGFSLILGGYKTGLFVRQCDIPCERGAVCAKISFLDNIICRNDEGHNT